MSTRRWFRPITMGNALRCALSLTPILVLALTAGCGGSDSGTTVTRFQQTNLVSDQAGQATTTDANLVNAWAIASSAAGPFWVTNNHSGTVTVYNTLAIPQTLVVTIPPAPGGSGPGKPTGMVFNSTTSFPLGGSPAAFIIATEDGTLTAWNVAAGTAATRVADRSTLDAVYKGLAMGTSGGAQFLFATDFHNGRVDRFDQNFNFVDSFTDTTVPAGFAPFGIQNIGGELYVTFAKQEAPDNEDDEPGAGNGFVDVFHTDGTMVRRLISGGNLNSPWGLAVAPSGFGSFSGLLLVGNFGDGAINAFNLTTGAFIGKIRDASGVAIQIPGLWGIAFGNGGTGGDANTLYFAAGPDGENHGLFGSVQKR